MKGARYIVKFSHMDGDENIVMKNNIIYYADFKDSYKSALKYQGDYHTDQSAIDVGHNLVYSVDGVYEGNPHPNDIWYEDPMFASYNDGDDNGDFNLLKSSPAIDAGVTLSDVPMDKDYKARPAGSGYDIGCYEYGAAVSSSPITRKAGNILEKNFAVLSDNSLVIPNSASNASLFTASGQRIPLKGFLHQHSAWGQRKVFDLNRLSSGMYTIVISNENRSITKNFSVYK
jgi:hypothetical protein